MVQLENLIYAGSHGFDIESPGGLNLQQEQATQALPELEEAENDLRHHLDVVPAARVERKRFALAVHYREVSSAADRARIEQAVDTVHGEHPTLRKRGGKKIFELQPDIPWDKGHAVLWLTHSLKLDPADVFVIYIGDDVTDEDAFQALRDHNLGIGVRVAPPGHATQATHYLQNCDEVRQFLGALLDMLRDEAGAHTTE